MKKLIFVLILSCATSLFGQEDAAAEQQQAWMNFMTPGSMHELLASTVGEWKTKTTWWMFPDAEPQVSDGTVKIDMIMGGRYLKSEHSGTMMGMPFQGMSIEGYDNALEKFVSTWIDNFGTGISTAIGTYDPESKIITYVGKGTDPATKTEKTYKQEMLLENKDHFVLNMYSDYQGQEFKTMVVEYTK